MAYIAVWAISPPLFANESARLLVLVATVIWVVIEMLRIDGLARRITIPVLMTLVFIGYTGFHEFMMTGTSGMIRNIQIWIMLFFLIVWQSRRNNLQSLTTVFWLVLCVYPTWLLITVRTIATENSHAARIVVRSTEEAMELTQQGVGGYALVYGTLLLLPSLIGLASRRHCLRFTPLPRPLRQVPKLAFGLVTANVCLGILLVLMAGFSLAVIALLCIVLSTLLLRNYTTTRMLIAVFAIAMIAIFGQQILAGSLTALLPFAEGMNYANKIRDILASLDMGEATGTAYGRTERYVRSLNLFAESPLIGVFAFDNVGKHSSILDTYARWGVVFGSIFLYLILVPAFRVVRGNKHDFGARISLIAAVVIIFGLNNGFAAAGLMLYVMFPVSLHILSSASVRQVTSVAAARHA